MSQKLQRKRERDEKLLKKRQQLHFIVLRNEEIQLKKNQSQSDFLPYLFT